MPYYDTIEEDLIRSKQILAKGKVSEEDMPPGWDPVLRETLLKSGTIYGGDIYAAYRLLDSLVAEVERLRAVPRVTAVTARCSACGAYCDDITFEYKP